MRGSLELVPGSAKRSLPTECAAGRTRRRTHLRVLEPERQPERSTAPGQATEAERVVERVVVSDFGARSPAGREPETPAGEAARHHVARLAQGLLHRGAERRQREQVVAERPAAVDVDAGIVEEITDVVARTRGDAVVRVLVAILVQ